MIIFSSILLLEAGLFVRVFLLSDLTFAGLYAALLGAIVVAQGTALKSLGQNPDDAGWERGTVSLSAMLYAVAVAAPAWQSPCSDVLLAAGFLLLIATLALDPAVSPSASGRERKTASTADGHRIGVVLAAAAAVLALSVAVAPLLVETAGVARDAVPAIVRALLRRAPSPMRGDGAGGPRGPASALLYGVDAEPAHRVRAGVGDRGPHLPVVYVKPASPRSLPLRTTRRLYVRVMTYDSYVDGDWITRARMHKLLRDEDDGSRDGRIEFPAPPGARETYAVYTPPLASGVLPMLPRVAALHLPRALQFPDEMLASPVVTKADWLTFTAESAPLCWDDIASAQTAPGRDRWFTWLQDGALSDRFRAEARRVAAANRGSTGAVARVLAHLRDTCTYSMDETPQPGVQPVESFLFTTHRGHCELYATACALMLRALDVPCRFSLGYSGGTYDPARRLYAFHADEYHAWVEVLLEKHGWVILDPTPAGWPGTPSPPTAGTIDTEPSGFIGSDLADLIARTRLSDDSLAQNAARGPAVPPWVARAVLWFVVVLGVAVVAASLWTSRRRAGRAIAAMERHRKVRTGIAFFDAFCRHFARRGAAMRQHETPLEYLARLKQAGLAGDAFDEAIAYFCRVCFGKSQRNADMEEVFLRQLREASAPSGR